MRDFLITKLEAYSYFMKPLKLYPVTSQTENTTKINNYFSNFFDLLIVVPKVQIQALSSLMNYFKANPSKSQLLLTSKEEASIQSTIKNSSPAKLLGVLIDNKLTFNNHVSELSAKASENIHALAGASNYAKKKN